MKIYERLKDSFYEILRISSNWKEIWCDQKFYSSVVNSLEQEFPFLCFMGRIRQVLSAMNTNRFHSGYRRTIFPSLARPVQGRWIHFDNLDLWIVGDRF